MIIVMKPIKYIFFDVAGTLLYKQNLYETWVTILAKHNIVVSLQKLKQVHAALVSETDIPSFTTVEFYRQFNAELIKKLNGQVDDNSLNEIFESIKSIGWKTYDDCQFLGKLNIPMGIISNWDSTLKNILKQQLPFKFFPIVSSAEYNVAKPDLRIFEIALNLVKIPPENCLYIGNSIELDMMPARACGMNTILIDRDNQFPEYKQNKVKSLKDIKL
jgi:putative hydrolase of the HAD superfamily